jgi:hypothetical protein
VRGDLAGSETVARLESDEGNRQFNEPALSSGEALFTARRDFYIVTFFTKFLAAKKTKAELVIEFQAGGPDGVRCSIAGKRGDPTSIVIFDLEVS